MLDITRPDRGIWDHETGETWQDAIVRFSQCGTGSLLSANDVIRIVEDEGEVEFFSFGYGDDPEYFDGIFGTEVVESVREDGEQTTDIVWGPFIRVQ